jgi:hypothetical protein
MGNTPGEWGGSDQERNEEMWRLYCSGWTQTEIARKYGLSQARISVILAGVRSSLPERKREDLIDRELAFLDGIRKRAIELTQMLPAPVTAGRDGAVVRDPVTDEVVRDFSGHVQGFKLAIESHDRFVRMLGLNQPQEINVQMTQAETVAAQTAAAESAARMMTEE